MPEHTLTFVDTEGTGQHVVADHFGANALHHININGDVDYRPSEGFAQALDTNEIEHIRYPGGHVENTIDVTVMPDGEIRAEVRSFLEWCRENSVDGKQYQITFVLPTKTDISPEQIEEFVYALLSEFGDLIVAIEIGNEYSIGPHEDNADRSVHPEEIEGSDYVAAMNEIEYGRAANIVINAVQNAIDRLHEENPNSAPDPQILLQMAETNGAASDYKGGVNGGNFDAANEAIITLLDDRAREAVDGAVVHYYYNVSINEGLRFSDVEDWREIRSIDSRLASFEYHLGKDVDLYITEWNVVAGNATQHGASSASVLLEMFEFMVRIGTDEAHIWPLQHRTPNNVFGNRESEDNDPSMSGAAFSLMSESLSPVTSSTGRVESFQSMVSIWDGMTGDVEINHFASDYQTVLFVSLRSLDPSEVNLDLTALMGNGSVVVVDHLTIDPASSDGLSDYADENGENRLGRRVIDQNELNKLQTLAFFDPEDPNHVRFSGNQIMTYLPPFETIIPLVDNPQDITDYYFAAEADVDPLIRTLAPATVQDGTLSVDLMPFDVLRIVIDTPLRTEGGDGNDRLIGGVGRDILIGGLGADTLEGGEANDTLKGGLGDDIINAGSGDDSVNGGPGADVMNGNEGNDTLVIQGRDLVYGGTGSDTLLFESDGTFTTGYHAVHAGSDGYATWSVSLDGMNKYSAVANGGEGSDFVILGDGDDAIFLDDLYSGSHSAVGTAIVPRFSGIEKISAGAGNDLIDLTSDRFSTSGLGMELLGEAGDDTIWGGDGADWLRGGAGNDVLEGGGGSDVLTGGSGGDEFHFYESDGSDTITDFSIDEGDRIVIRTAVGSVADDFSLRFEDSTLFVENGETTLAIDLGAAAQNLDISPSSSAEWLEFV